MFRGWFQMNPECDACALPFQREGGFYLGSIYINYGLTSLLVLATYLPLYFSGWVSSRTLLWGALALSILFPLWFFRYARSLWLGFDNYFDPAPEEKPSGGE
jgi:hypothetical protein